MNNLKSQNSYNPSNSGNSMDDKLGRMGRHGDTMIRDVDGAPSHVNAWEAYMIDNYGNEGEQFTKDTGSGTINPNTGLPEYGWRIGGWSSDKAKKRMRSLGLTTNQFKKNPLKFVVKGIKGLVEGITGGGHTRWFSYEDSKHTKDARDDMRVWDESKKQWKYDFNQALATARDRRLKAFGDLAKTFRGGQEGIRSKYNKYGGIVGGFGQTTGSAVQQRDREMNTLTQAGMDAELAENVQQRLSRDKFLSEKRDEWRGMIGAHDQKMENYNLWYNSSWDEDKRSSEFKTEMDDIDSYFQGSEYQINR